MARIKYIMRDGWRLIWRHFGMSLLTIFTVFFVVGATMLFILNMRSVIANMENQLSIQAYLKADAELEKTAAAVRGIRGVESVTMITKETALERLRARLGNQADAVMLLGENPLPASLEIHVAKASQVADVASRLTSVKEIEDIVYAGHVAEKLTRLSSFVEKFSIIMLAVALVGRLGLDRTTALEAIAAMGHTQMRLDVAQAPSGARLIDDSYNAAPSSMAASLDVLSQMACEGRRIAVLGEMGELGDDAPRLHGYVGAYAAAKGVDLLVLVGGALADEMAEAARTMGLSEDAIERFATVEEATSVMVPVLAPGDLVLVKASRAARLDQFVKGALAR